MQWQGDKNRLDKLSPASKLQLLSQPEKLCAREKFNECNSIIVQNDAGRYEKFFISKEKKWVTKLYIFFIEFDALRLFPNRELQQTERKKITAAAVKHKLYLFS